MAVKINVSTEGDGNGGKLYTGVAAFRVTGVNPSQDELKAIGFKAEKAPVYLAEGKMRVIFMVEATAPGGAPIKTNIAFFLSNKKREGIWINKQGKFAKDQSKLTGELRNPYDGEIELLNFINSWCNVKKDEELFLDTIGAIVEAGDVTELRQIAENCKQTEQTVKALLTVSDGKYQRVWNKEFVRSWSTDYSYLHKKLVENKDHVKEDLGGIDLKLYVATQFAVKPYTATAALATAAHAGSNGNGKPADVQAAAGTSESATDDLPF